MFDNCIISSNSYIFEYDDLQFAYKQKTSIVQCVSITKEVINYYVNENSCVYMCMLDASKSFGRVNLLVLFKSYMLKIPSYLRFLMVSYKEQNIRVRWNSTLNFLFSVSNGIKQRGVRLKMTRPTCGGVVRVVINCCVNCVEISRPLQWEPDLTYTPNKSGFAISVINKYTVGSRYP